MSIEFDPRAYDPALLVLRAKGYGLELDARDDHYAYWRAKKGDSQFTATNPVELLGVVTVWEERGTEWERREGEPSVYEKLVEG